MHLGGLSKISKELLEEAKESLLNNSPKKDDNKKDKSISLADIIDKYIPTLKSNEALDKKIRSYQNRLRKKIIDDFKEKGHNYDKIKSIVTKELSKFGINIKTRKKIIGIDNFVKEILAHGSEALYQKYKDNGSIKSIDNSIHSVFFKNKSKGDFIFEQILIEDDVINEEYMLYNKVTLSSREYYSIVYSNPTLDVYLKYLPIRNGLITGLRSMGGEYLRYNPLIDVYIQIKLYKYLLMIVPYLFEGKKLKEKTVQLQSFFKDLFIDILYRSKIRDMGHFNYKHMESSLIRGLFTKMIDKGYCINKRQRAELWFIKIKQD